MLYLYTVLVFIIQVKFEPFLINYLVLSYCWINFIFFLAIKLLTINLIIKIDTNNSNGCSNAWIIDTTEEHKK